MIDITEISPYLWPRLCELLKIRNIKDLKKEKFNVDPADLIELYLVFGITPHEVAGLEKPKYKIRVSDGLDKHAAKHYCKSAMIKNLLKMKTKYSVSQIVKILDDTEGLVGLQYLT